MNILSQMIRTAQIMLILPPLNMEPGGVWIATYTLYPRKNDKERKKEKMKWKVVPKKISREISSIHCLG